MKRGSSSFGGAVLTVTLSVPSLHFRGAVGGSREQVEASALGAGKLAEVKEQMGVTVLAVLWLFMLPRPMLFFLFCRCVVQPQRGQAAL